MAKSPRTIAVNWRQAGGEALLIFLGVGVALGGQAWWEHRTDRELEQHLLVGIRADLTRDTSDIASAMRVARARVAGADFLLAELGDPDAGRYYARGWALGRPGALKTERDWLLEALAEYQGADLTSREALYMVAATVSLQVIDLADATFREATEGGRLNVIRDEDLRSRIADYYFNTNRFGSTTDNRVRVHWEDFRRAIAGAGLATTGGGSDEQILAAFRNDPVALAELKNVRDYALMQLGAHAITLRSAEAVIQSLGQID